MKTTLILCVFAVIFVSLVASVPLKGISSPKAGVGCNDTTDLDIFKTQNATFHKDLQVCATKCLGNVGCSTSCIENNMGLTQDCANCFAEDIACTAKNCDKYCIADPNSADCVNCSIQFCFTPLVACAQVNKSVIPPA